MSAPVGLVDADVLPAVLLSTNNPQGSLSVDLPRGGDLSVKGQCCHKVSYADVCVHGCNHCEHGVSVTDVCEHGCNHCEHGVVYLDVCDHGCKPCKHDVGFADDLRHWTEVKGKRVIDEGFCYACSLDAPVAELSRRRIDRRGRRAKALLVGTSPVEYHTDPSDPKVKVRVDGKVSKNKGKWYSVTACGIVPLIGSMTLAQRISGRIDRMGVFRCGSVWTCTSCAQRISVPRANQIREVYDLSRAAGKRAFMLTGTIPHDKSTGVRLGLKRCKAAIRSFLADKTLRRRMAEMGYLGHVIVTEITYPRKDAKYDNGAHVHWHGMFVFDQIDGKEHTTAGEDMIRATAIKMQLFRFWVQAAMKAGAPRPPSYEHGFDVSVAWSSTYLTKTHEKVKGGDSAEPSSDKPKPKPKPKPAWGIEAELTRSHLKENSKKGRTPFELLDSEDEEDVALFREYAAATFGLSQVEWSRGKNDIRMMFLGENYRDVSDVIAALEEPEYVLADEAPQLLPDPVIEECDIKADDCWRARKYGRNALDRAIAAVDGGGAMSLEHALREEKFIVDHVTRPWTEEGVLLFHTKDQPDRGIKAGDPVVELVRDRIVLDADGNVTDIVHGDWTESVVVKDVKCSKTGDITSSEFTDYMTDGVGIDGWRYRLRQATTIVNHPKRYEVRYLVGEAARIAGEQQLEHQAQEPTQEPMEGWESWYSITEDDCPF